MNAELLNLQNLIERSCFAGCLHLAWKQGTEICNTTFISLFNFGANYVYIMHCICQDCRVHNFMPNVKGNA